MKVIPYDREKAVDYAHKWAFGRNPAYYNYDDIGGDCTNFASQTLRAGGGVMNTTPTFGWYYYSANNKSPSWTGVQYLYNFLTTNKGVGPFGHDAPISLAQPGEDVYKRQRLLCCLSPAASSTGSCTAPTEGR